MLDNYIKWFKTHERILALVIVTAMIIYLGNLWINRSYDTALAKNSAAQQVLQSQVQKNAELQKEQDAREQQYQQLVDSLTKQNQTLVAGIVARNQSVATQQKTDATLPLSDLAARQQTLSGTTGITSTDSGLLESPVAAVVVTQKLESLPALEQNVTDLQTLSGNKDKQIAGLNGVVSGLNKQIAGLGVQITDEKKACTAQVNEVKAAARKSKRGWFKAGLVIGFIGGLVTGHYIP